MIRKLSRTAIAALALLLSFSTPLMVAQAWAESAVDMAADALDQFDPVEELARARKAQLESLQMLQSLNSMGNAGSMSTGNFPLQIDPSIQELAKNLQPLLESKFAQSATKLLQNPEFTQAIGQLLKHPKKTELLYAQIGWIVFMMLFRAWRMSRPSHWLWKIWTRLWTFGVFAGGAALVIPAVVIGQPYLTVLQSISGLLKQ